MSTRRSKSAGDDSCRGGGDYTTREIPEELERLVMESSGLDQPGVVNGWEPFAEVVATCQQLQQRIGKGDPQMTAREIAGLAREEHFDPELAQAGRRWLKSEAIFDLDAALANAITINGDDFDVNFTRVD